MRFRTWIAAILISQIILLGCVRDSKKSVISIGIAQYLNHPALDAVLQGFYERMQELGFRENENVTYDYQNAQGDMSITQNIASKFASDKYDLVFSMATPMSQAIKQATRQTQIPIVFTAVTDPVGAGLVMSMDSPGGNLTGVSDGWPYFEQLAIIKETLPNATKVGVLINPDEDHTRFDMAQIRSAAQKLGLQIVEAPLSAPNDTATAARTIANKSDAVCILADNTARAIAPTIIKVANEYRKPVFAGDSGTFEMGSVAGVGVSYHNLGRASAELAYQILTEKKKPSALPVVTSKDPEVMVNLIIAKNLSIKIPESLLSKASRVVK